MICDPHSEHKDDDTQASALYWQLQPMFDPLGLIRVTAKAAQAWGQHPDALRDWMGQWMQGVSRLSCYAASRYLDSPVESIESPHPEDDRFAHPVWTEKPAWDVLKQWYLFNTHWLQDALYSTPGLTDCERARSAFWLRQWLNAVAPTNFFALNPAAQERAYESQGRSVWSGQKNLLRDMARGDIAMTDLSAFKVGQNLATTPGAVVFRNRMLEVIHYTPTTPTVQKTPIVLVSPWINKYYVLDLDEKKSLVRYLVSQGFSVFVTSWKNPSSEDRNVGFDDYLTEGIDRIAQVARSISGSEQVHLAGYCIGGTLTATYTAWLAAQGRDHEIASTTLFTTLTDFSRPGDIEVFLDKEGLAFVDRKMAKRGYLDGKDMAASFRMLRSNSLIWNYWVSNYLIGETPRPFDLLFWNMDTTRMPQKMHSFYLREFYVNNRLVQPHGLTLAGYPIDLGQVKTPIFMVSAEEDHIAPWKQTWALTQLVPHAPLTFTLSSSGHILGIVNPPSPKSKRSYRMGTVEVGDQQEDWLVKQKNVGGSWWPSWTQWLSERGGPQIKPVLDNDHYPKLDDAPGRYVLA